MHASYGGQENNSSRVFERKRDASVLSTPLRRNLKVEQMQRQRHMFKTTAAVFRKINETLDPNSRVKIREYQRKIAADSTFNTMASAAFVQMLADCFLDADLTPADKDVAFKFLRTGRGGRMSTGSGTREPATVLFSDFRNALEKEWLALKSCESNVIGGNCVHLKRRLVESARRRYYGRRELLDDLLKKLYRLLDVKKSGKIPIEEFRQTLRDYDLSEQEAYDLAMVADVDVDGYVSQTDFVRSMERMEDDKIEGFVEHGRSCSLKALERRMNHVDRFNDRHDARALGIEANFETDFSVRARQLYEKAIASTSDRSQVFRRSGPAPPMTKSDNDGGPTPWSNSLHHHPIEWMPKLPQETSPVSTARRYFTETGYNACTIRLNSKIKQHERYEKGIDAIRAQRERSRWKSEVGRIVTGTCKQYEFAKRAQQRQEGAVRRAQMKGKASVPDIRRRCFEGRIPFLNPNLDRVLDRNEKE